MRGGQAGTQLTRLEKSLVNRQANALGQRAACLYRLKLLAAARRAAAQGEEIDEAWLERQTPPIDDDMASLASRAPLPDDELQEVESF